MAENFFWAVDFGWSLGRQDEIELVKQELVHLFGLGVALHSQLPAIGGRNAHVEHLNLTEARQDAAGAQPGGGLLVVFLQGDVEAVSKEACSAGRQPGDGRGHCV